MLFPQQINFEVFCDDFEFNDQILKHLNGSKSLKRTGKAFVGSRNYGISSKQLYAMMDQVRKDRTGTEKQGKQINAERYMPA